MTTCPVCIEKYTKEIRAKVTCPYCPMNACKPCVQRYLTTTYDDPHCMECRRGWNREFLDIHLTKVFRNGPLRKHRAKILMDREKALLPAMQVFVEAKKAILQSSKDMTEKSRMIGELNAQSQKLMIERNQILRKFREYPNLADQAPLKEALNDCILRYSKVAADIALTNIEYEHILNAHTRARNIYEGRDENATREEAREFIQRCPADGCRGYLSTAYKCGTCAKYTCSECLVVKGDNKDAEHTCNEDAKASAALIRRETKPCPKCGVRIYKIDGCDQMWCIQEGCHTAFSWRTGHVVTGVVHNPHYYEWLRKQNNGVAPREHNDIGCGGLPTAWTFTRKIQESALPIPEKNLILSIHRCIGDIINARLPDYPARRPANTNKEVNVAYLMNEINEEAWMKVLEQAETKFERKKEIGQVLSTFAHIGSEFMREIERSMTAALLKDLWMKKLRRQCDDLRIYTNKSLVELGKRMMCAIPQFTNTWEYIPPRKDAYVENHEQQINPYTKGTNNYTYWETRRIAIVTPEEKEEDPTNTLLQATPAVAEASAQAPAPAPAQRITREDFVDDRLVVVE